MQNVYYKGDALAPSKILCVGRNYVEHAKELGNEVPDEMVLFLKPNSAIGTQLFAHKGEPLHYEAELCFLVKDQVLAAVGVGLDLTKRETQSRLKQKGLPWERAKAFSGAAVFSEFVDIPPNLMDLNFELLIDGETTQKGDPSMMLFKPDKVLRECQTFMDLEDGDVIMTGTPKGVGELKAGSEYSLVLRNAGKILIRCDWNAR